MSPARSVTFHGRTRGLSIPLINLRPAARSSSRTNFIQRAGWLNHTFFEACVDEEICMNTHTQGMKVLATKIAECVSRSAFVKLAGDMVEISAEGVLSHLSQNASAGGSTGATGDSGPGTT